MGLIFLSSGPCSALGPISQHEARLPVTSMVGQSSWIAITSVNIASSAYLVAFACLSLAGIFAAFLLLHLLMGQG